MLRRQKRLGNTAHAPDGYGSRVPVSVSGVAAAVAPRDPVERAQRAGADGAAVRGKPPANQTVHLSISSSICQSVRPCVNQSVSLSLSRHKSINHV